MKDAFERSRHKAAVEGRWGRDAVVRLIEATLNEVTSDRAKAARNHGKSAAAAEKHRQKNATIQRCGYLNIHVDALGRVIKIGYAIADDEKRALGEATATYWPNGVGHTTARVYLGECSEAEANVRLECYKTLVRAVLHKHLVPRSFEVTIP